MQRAKSLRQVVCYSGSTSVEGNSACSKITDASCPSTHVSRRLLRGGLRRRRSIALVICPAHDPAAASLAAAAIARRTAVVALAAAAPATRTATAVVLPSAVVVADAAPLAAAALARRTAVVADATAVAAATVAVADAAAVAASAVALAAAQVALADAAEAYARLRGQPMHGWLLAEGCSHLCHPA